MAGKTKSKKKKVKAKKKKSEVCVRPLFPTLVVQRINKGEASAGKVIVTRLELEETPYATIFEAGENGDFEVGELVTIQSHVGHDFTWDPTGKAPLRLTFIQPEDVLAKVEGTPAEKRAFIEAAKTAM